MKNKLMKAFTTATAVVCLFGGSMNVKAKNIDYTNYFKSQDVNVEFNLNRLYIYNNNDTLLFCATEKDEYKYVKPISLNVRKTPTTRYNPIKTFRIGTKVHVIGKNIITGWSIIELDDCENDCSYGFVRSEYLVDENPVINMGEFKITAYCSCYECNEGYDGTSTEHELIEGYTIAVDPDVIPYGTHVYIEGLGDYVADDCGGAIKNNKIDVYIDHHSMTEDFGVKHKNVYIIKES